MKSNCLSVFDCFMGLALKELSSYTAHKVRSFQRIWSRSRKTSFYVQCQGSLQWRFSKYFMEMQEFAFLRQILGKFKGHLEAKSLYLYSMACSLCHPLPFETLLYRKIKTQSIRHLQNQQQQSSVSSRSVEKVFLEISQNSQENTCARVSFLIMLQLY